MQIKPCSSTINVPPEALDGSGLLFCPSDFLALLTVGLKPTLLAPRISSDLGMKLSDSRPLGTRTQINPDSKDYHHLPSNTSGCKKGTEKPPAPAMIGG